MLYLGLEEKENSLIIKILKLNIHYRILPLSEKCENS